MKNKLQRGFTLIELMVVIVIMVILATLAIASYIQATQTARDGKRRSDIEAIRQAFMLQRQDTSGYGNGTFAQRVTSLVNNGYLTAPAPQDPQNATNPYVGAVSGTGYCVCADLEGTRGNATSAACAGLGATNGGFYCALLP